MDRRRLIGILAAVVSGLGAAFAAIPFLRTFLPSAKAKAKGAPISIDVAGIAPGEVRSYKWRGKAILVMRRSDEQIAALSYSKGSLLDENDPADIQPKYVDPTHRALNPEFLVAQGNCTHLGCVPNLDTTRGKELVGDWWRGGFLCPCHDSMYDYAGRVVRGPAPRNLRIPPHRFANETTLIVGEETASS